MDTWKKRRNDTMKGADIRKLSATIDPIMNDKNKRIRIPQNYKTMINRIFISVVIMLWSAVGATCQPQPSKWMDSFRDI